MTKTHHKKTKALVYIVDDDVYFAESLKNALQLAGFEVISFDGVSTFLGANLSRNAVLLCDMQMPELNGLDLQRMIEAQGLRFPVIFLTGESSVNQAITAIKNGAFEFFTKPADPSDLFLAIEKAWQQSNQRNLINQELDKLSFRERQAFDLFIKGYSNPEVAEELGIQVSTTKEYKANIFRKLEAQKMSELIKKFNL